MQIAGRLVGVTISDPPSREGVLSGAYLSRQGWYQYENLEGGVRTDLRCSRLVRQPVWSQLFQSRGERYRVPRSTLGINRVAPRENERFEDASRESLLPAGKGISKFRWNDFDKLRVLGLCVSRCFDSMDWLIAVITQRRTGFRDKLVTASALAWCINCARNDTDRLC